MAGQRLALNIANVEKEEIVEVIGLPSLSQIATDRITVQPTANQAFKENSIVHLTICFAHYRQIEFA